MSAAVFTVELAPSGQRFTAVPGQTVLAAARAAGLRLPSSCRNGTCRACMALVLSGQARHQIEWPGLSADEKAEGWVLPCVAEPLSDLRLQATPVT